MIYDVTVNLCFIPICILIFLIQLFVSKSVPHWDQTEKNWSSVIKFMGDVIEQFGVHNVYPNRLIHVIHTKMAKAKNRNDCYHTLAVLHQQLGDGWKDVLTSPLSKAAKKTVDKKFEKNKKKPPVPGTYIQLRCSKKEEIPIPVDGKMEKYGTLVTVTNAELFGDNQVNLPKEFEQKEFKSEMKVLWYT